MNGFNFKMHFLKNKLVNEVYSYSLTKVAIETVVRSLFIKGSVLHITRLVQTYVVFTKTVEEIQH